MKRQTKIKVVGVGGSGSNAVSRMFGCGIEGVDLIAINTDVQDLKKTKAHLKLQIGGNLTRGLGTGMNPKIGKAAAEEQKEEISEILKGAEMVFIAAGFGGGTGTGAAPVIAEIAKNSGALTIAVITKPFSFEGTQRRQTAEKGMAALKEKVDTLISISNDKLLKLINEKTSVFEAFWLCDEVLRQAVQGISDLIVKPGIVNVDWADLKSVMKDSGGALLGIGRATGEKRAETAAKAAINSPLSDFSIEKGKAVLFNISGGADMSLAEIDEAAKIITQKLHPRAKIIFGASEDEKSKKGEIKITVIATGF